MIAVVQTVVVSYYCAVLHSFKFGSAWWWQQAVVHGMMGLEPTNWWAGGEALS